MLKRLLTVVALTLMLVVAAKPIRIVQGVMMTPAEVEMMNGNSACPVGQFDQGHRSPAQAG